jgi:alkylation response protein AidB-like acyl-CoA dehydrogenase
MDFSLSKEQEELKKSTNEFSNKELVPRAKEVDIKGEFPKDNFKKMAEKGLLGLIFPKEYGGSGLDMVSYCVALEEIAKACGSSATINLSHVLSTLTILLFGNDEQKENYLKPMIKGEKLGAFAITERGGGSDILSIQTGAKVKDNGYVINGVKSYITNAKQADIYIILTSTDNTKGSKGLSAIVVDKDTEGISFGKTEDLIGMRGISLGEIIIKECSVPIENLLGSEGDGLKITLSSIDRGRIALSAIGVGIAQACLDASIDYSKKRSQFGKPLSEYQSIQFMISDMSTEIQAARLLTYYAGSLVETKQRFTTEASMAKLYSSETAMRAALNAVQIHGGYGLSKECPVERYMRDAKGLAIMEGTSEIQRLIISRNKFK